MKINKIANFSFYKQQGQNVERKFKAQECDTFTFTSTPMIGDYIYYVPGKNYKEKLNMPANDQGETFMDLVNKNDDPRVKGHVAKNLKELPKYSFISKENTHEMTPRKLAFFLVTNRDYDSDGRVFADIMRKLYTIIPDKKERTDFIDSIICGERDVNGLLTAMTKDELDLESPKVADILFEVTRKD